MIKIVPKIITILELFSDGKEYSFSEIVLRTGLTRSNVSHLLQSLCEERLLVKSSYGRYHRGERLILLCMGNNPWQILLTMAERCAENLMHVLNEQTVVGLRIRSRRLTLVKRRPRKMLQVDEFGNGKHYLADWYSTANGRILLAYAPRDVLEETVRRHGLPDRKVWKEAVTLPKLEKELARIRAHGVVILPVDEQIKAIGISLRDASGEYLLSLATAFPVFSCRMTDCQIIEQLRLAASDLEKEIRIRNIRIADLENMEQNTP